MPENAEWRAAPHRSRFGWLANVPKTYWVIAILTVALMSYIRWTIGVDRGESVATRLIFVPFFVALVVPLLFSLSINKPSRMLIERTKNEKRKFHLVKMTLLRDDQPIGQDEGLLFMQGDELSYEGLLTSFHVTTGDVEAPLESFANGSLLSASEEQWRFGNLSDKLAWGFVLRRHPEVRVYFFPLIATGSESLYKPLFCWLQQPRSEASGTLLPPLEPQPGYKPPRLLWSSRKRA
jgi:hypothetical protein